MGRPLGARDVGAEAVLVAGGGRAILLQIAHPAVGRGVVDHSDFACGSAPAPARDSHLRVRGGLRLARRGAPRSSARSIMLTHPFTPRTHRTGRPGVQRVRSAAAALGRRDALRLGRHDVRAHLRSARRRIGRPHLPRSTRSWARRSRFHRTLARRPGRVRRLLGGDAPDPQSHAGHAGGRPPAPALPQPAAVAEVGDAGRRGWSTAGLLPTPLRVEFGLPWNRTPPASVRSADATDRVRLPVPARLAPSPSAQHPARAAPPVHPGGSLTHRFRVRRTSELLDRRDLDQQLLRSGLLELNVRDTLRALARHGRDPTVAEVGVADAVTGGSARDRRCRARSP